MIGQKYKVVGINIFVKLIILFGFRKILKLTLNTLFTYDGIVLYLLYMILLTLRIKFVRK